MANLTKLMDQVFRQDVLLDLILDHAVHKDGKVCRASQLKLGLVNSAWVHSITRILKNRKEPVFHVFLCQKNSTSNSQQVKEKGKNLDRFMAIMSDNLSKFGKPTPPYSIYFHDNFLTDETFHDLLRFWTHPCTAGLLKVKLCFAENTPLSLIPFLPRASFPLLAKLHVNLGFMKSKVNLENFKLTLIVQAFLNAVESPGFKLTLEGYNFPDSIQYLSLPSTLLHKLKLDLIMRKSILMGLLFLSPLSNLKSLLLSFEEFPNLTGTFLSNVLQKLNWESLTSLTLCNATSVRVRLPVMENLRELNILSAHIDLETEQKCSMDKWLPKLEKLDFCLQHEHLKNFVEHSTYSKVKKLNVTVGSAGRFEYLAVNLELLHLINTAFPNVTELTIKFFDAHPATLAALFRIMNQLIKLKVYFHTLPTQNLDLWDSVFTGLPIVMVRLLRNNPGLWGQVDLLSVVCQGIRNMRELTHFDLEIYRPPSCRYNDYGRHSQEGPMPPVLSELSVTLGLLKMPKLKEIMFQDTFYNPDLCNHLGPFKKSSR